MSRLEASEQATILSGKGEAPVGPISPLRRRERWWGQWIGVLLAGHFGPGRGSGAHAPDEYYVIESKNPKVRGIDGAVCSFVEYPYELA